MTDYKLGKLYEAAIASAKIAGDPLAFPKVRERAARKLCQAFDVMIMGIDDRQAKLLDWAEANGYPDWETVLRFGTA